MEHNSNMAKAGLMGVNAGAKIGGDLSSTRLLTELPSNAVNTNREHRMTTMRTDTNDPLSPSFDPHANSGTVMGMVVASNTSADPTQANAIMSVGTTRDTAQGVVAQEQGNDFGIGLKASGRQLGDGPVFVSMKGLSGDGPVEIWGMISTEKIGLTRGALVPEEAGNIAYAAFNAKVYGGEGSKVDILYPKDPRNHDEAVAMFMLYASGLPFAPSTHSDSCDLIEIAAAGKVQIAQVVSRMVMYGQRCRGEWQKTILENGVAQDEVDAATDVCTLAWSHNMRPDVLFKLAGGSGYEDGGDFAKCNRIVIGSNKLPLATHLATTFSLHYYESVSKTFSFTLNGIDIYAANPRRPSEAIERTFASTEEPKTTVEIFGKLSANDGTTTNGRYGTLLIVPADGARQSSSTFRGKTYIPNMLGLQNKGMPIVHTQGGEAVRVDVDWDSNPTRASPGVAIRVGGAYLAPPHAFHEEPDAEAVVDKHAETALTSRGTQELRTMGQWSGDRVVRFMAKKLAICSDMAQGLEHVASQLQSKVDVSDTPVGLLDPKLITALMATSKHTGGFYESIVDEEAPPALMLALNGHMASAVFVPDEGVFRLKHDKTGLVNGCGDLKWLRSSIQIELIRFSLMNCLPKITQLRLAKIAKAQEAFALQWPNAFIPGKDNDQLSAETRAYCDLERLKTECQVICTLSGIVEFVKQCRLALANIGSTDEVCFSSQFFVLTLKKVRAGQTTRMRDFVVTVPAKPELKPNIDSIIALAALHAWDRADCPRDISSYEPEMRARVRRWVKENVKLVTEPPAVYSGSTALAVPGSQPQQPMQNKCRALSLQEYFVKEWVDRGNRGTPPYIPALVPGLKPPEIEERAKQVADQLQENMQIKLDPLADDDARSRVDKFLKMCDSLMLNTSIKANSDKVFDIMARRGFQMSAAQQLDPAAPEEPSPTPSVTAVRKRPVGLAITRPFKWQAVAAPGAAGPSTGPNGPGVESIDSEDDVEDEDEAY